MDFKKLGLGPVTNERTETAAQIEPKDAEGKPVAMANGKTLTFTLLPTNTPEGQREMRKWGVLSGTPAKFDNPAEAKEDALDAEVERQIASETELAARIVRDWNLIDADGKPVECSLENRRAFFGHFTALRTDTIAQMSAQVEALGNAKKA